VTESRSPIAARSWPTGAAAELRIGAAERRLVDVPNAAVGWGEDIPGTTLVSRDGSGLLFEIDPGTDDRALLRAALATGPVREVHRVEPSLGDIFRTGLQEDASRTVVHEDSS
jgi:ABC-2 type transport system ATP-binding protein